MTEPIEPAFPLLVALAISMMLFQLNQRIASPILAIVNRWMRWLIFAFSAAYICQNFELINRDFTTLTVVFFLIWFLFETLYNWLAIQALSVSPHPLFPRYVLNQDGDEWPTQPRHLKMREWLRRSGFKQVSALKADIGNGTKLRVSIYQDAKAQTRIQIMFLPHANGNVTACSIAASETQSGLRVVTDNLFIPFAGFYPENWLVERRPWSRSLDAIYRRHRARVAEIGESLVSWTVDPLADLNQQQGELDRLNTDLGFLNPQAEREDFGKITSQGRYRVWKEIWTLDYLGRPTRYE